MCLRFAEILADGSLDCESRRSRHLFAHPPVIPAKAGIHGHRLRGDDDHIDAA